MISNVSVIGAGLMGHGIALTFARTGFDVAVYDPVPESLDQLHYRVRASMAALGCDAAETDATVKRISTHAKMQDGVQTADLVIEAAPEKLALKQSIFAEVETLVSQDCVLASNTSVLPITAIMQGLSNRTRVVGTHWWNPPHIIPLVEVIRTEWTAAHVVDQTMMVLKECGKAPVRVDKDVPGFIGNRLQHALWREAISLVENGICDAEAVDTVVKQSFGRRLAVLGPLENADLVGTDLTLDIHSSVLSDLESSPDPSPYLETLVEQGKIGMKTGEGFRKWTPAQAEAVRDKVATHLTKLEMILD